MSTHFLSVISLCAHKLMLMKISAISTWLNQRSSTPLRSAFVNFPLLCPQLPTYYGAITCMCSQAGASSCSQLPALAPVCVLWLGSLLALVDKWGRGGWFWGPKANAGNELSHKTHMTEMSSHWLGAYVGNGGHSDGRFTKAQRSIVSL